MKQNQLNKIVTALCLGGVIAISSGCNNEQPSSTQTPINAVIDTDREISCDLKDATLVSSVDEFNSAVKSAKAGNSIVLSDGVWTDAELHFNGVGTKDAPICLTAQTPGKVILSGQSNLALSGEYLEVSSLIFKDGYSPTGSVISFVDKGIFANHSRVTETVIDQFNKPDKFDTEYWVALHGQYNRFDHNHLSGKSTAGVTMAVRLNNELSQQNHHEIDSNYFGPRPILGSNGGETLRIGTSRYSLTDSFTQVTNNYFDRANGEVEIISNKSGKNNISNNVFFESRGTLTLRHGNGNTVENNVFFGNGEDHTGGIRVINADQTIKNNYMEGLTGTRFGGGFVVMNGVPNSSINRYHQVKNATIENNTLINLANINLAAGSDAERSATPENSVFSKNLVANENSQPFKIFDDVSGISFSGNTSNQTTPSELSSGFTDTSYNLVRNEHGLLVDADVQSKGIGADDTLIPTKKEDTGVSWYPKSGPELAFSSGAVHKVSSEAELFSTLAKVNAGDVIAIAAGSYELERPMTFNKKVTLRGVAGETTLYPKRAIMSELNDGGSVRFENLIIDGIKAPDSAGNVLVRNTRVPTLSNYEFELIDSVVQNLNVNHSAHVFDSGYRSLANAIVIKNTVFKDITGDVLRLNKEQDDLGIYNAEYVTIENSSFENIQGAIAKVYRGGTDESTFGPHYTFANNKVKNVGKGKRNKEKASIYLHGVQVTNMANNQFEDARPVVIEHTVGEPQTLIENNAFKATGLPTVEEVFTKGASTAVMKNNTSE
ncbi:alginate lyase [Alteromonas sp. 5E99-2]|uniref:polysaccharide lyase 6 family protein n=1 Tax=Alteromonas sp. 5E99-2 TaxID=2817683 RepID=UPI001A99B81B|nr:polysaccharide lyase 6 family protein [Alteromonas sp. 5E99-2]MBO1256572.1 alginate lyase [Alteromonas sp. 5E99-2]